MNSSRLDVHASFVVRHTFIDDVVDREFEVFGHGAHRRSRSVGSTPKPGSSPVAADEVPVIFGNVLEDHSKVTYEAETLQQEVIGGIYPRSGGEVFFPPRTSPGAKTGNRRQRGQDKPQGTFRKEQVEEVGPGIEVYLEGAADVVAVLDRASLHMHCLRVTDAVACLHMLAKHAEAESFGSIHGLPGLYQDRQFLTLINHLRNLSKVISTPRLIMRTLWALGKLGYRSPDVDEVLLCAATAAQVQLHQFSSQELSNTLWGLARLSQSLEANSGVSSQKAKAASTRLANAIFQESTPRVSTFSGQCLANSLWALARLEIEGPQAEAFGYACAAQIHQDMFQEISPQALANSLWALARLKMRKEVTVPFASDVARRMTIGPELIQLFFPQELSMTLWAMAKILGRVGGAKKNWGGPPSLQTSEENLLAITAFASSVAAEASRRMPEFSPQGLSNIAWALSTMDLARLQAPRHFILQAASVATPDLRNFPAQAIANFSWALSRLQDGREALSSFGLASAREALARPNDFAWQDLAGLVSSLMGVCDWAQEEVKAFARNVVRRAQGCCNHIGTQALLNIALSAARLGIEKETLTPMAWGIAEAFTRRVNRLNDIDLRQWSEVQRYCGLPGCQAELSRRNRRR